MFDIIQYQLIDSKFEPYDPNYPQVFQSIKDLIGNVLLEVEIEPIGSLAILGTSGKQIIDLLIPCNKSEFIDILHKLEIGFKTLYL